LFSLFTVSANLHRHAGKQKLSEEVKKISGYVGLRMNAAKCKITVSDCWKDSTVVRTEGAEIEVVEDFSYLGAIYRTMETVTKNVAQESGKHEVSSAG